MTIADNLRHASNTTDDLRALCKSHAVRKVYHTEGSSIEYRFGDGSGLHFFTSSHFEKCEVPKPIATEFV